ncbi:hypothetical protein [Methanobacterium sp. SMA-27]|uniref:hypothetical protein n=1 Tax=Methanobacterium sp. SMA-27 TaxID=1495336 RepID=UPI0012E053DE|nr:hypothetical protein [Methanobacterium sp. SMA-27]
MTMLATNTNIHSELTIDTIPPKVSLTTPTNLKTGISKTGTIILKLTEDIKSYSFNKIP